MKWKEKSTFQKATMIVVWIMLIFTILGIILGAISALTGQ
ncbi:MAG: DUF4044 domain-containing protein [Lactobacillales bacterium]|jgi:uncharacterized membrane protein affecting hemolysin expression|nr:DUF4044 domain-containing protein [Lactobacillales bacterium]